MKGHEEAKDETQRGLAWINKSPVRITQAGMKGHKRAMDETPGGMKGQQWGQQSGAASAAGCSTQQAASTVAGRQTCAQLGGRQEAANDAKA